jgi:CheY-like chemotaxis protein
VSFKILLIEADPDWVDRVQRPLCEAGYDVIVAGGGDAGVAAVERDRPDLTLIRSILPDGDGLGYCRAIKSSPGGRDKPLVLLSDAADQDPAEVACDARLAVPVAEKALLDLCGQLLDGEVDAALNEPAPAEDASRGEYRPGGPRAKSEDKLLESIEELGREELLLTLPETTADSPSESDLEPPDEAAAERVLEEIEGLVDSPATDDIAAHLESVFARRDRGPTGSRISEPQPETKADPEPTTMLGLEGEVIVAPSHVPESLPAPMPPASSYGVDATRAAFQTQAVFGVDSPAESLVEVAGGSARRLALLSAVIVVVITAVLIFVLPHLSASRSRPQNPPSSAIPGGGSVGVRAGPGETTSGWPIETSPVFGEPGTDQRDGGHPAPAQTDAADEVEAKPPPSLEVVGQESPSAQGPEPREAPSIQSTAIPRATAPSPSAESERPAAAEPRSAQEPSPAPTEPAPAEEPQGFEPPGVLQRAEPKYSVFDVERAGFDTVMLRVLIDEAGKPVRVVVEQGTPGSPLVSSAIDAVLHSRYKPATEDGAPVRAWKTEKFVFE